jgi:hypothetical protein
MKLASGISIDEMELVNVKLQNTLDKLNGKPQNGIKEAIIEARIEAAKLTQSLDAAMTSFGEKLKQNQIGMWMQMFSDTAPNKEKWVFT